MSLLRLLTLLLLATLLGACANKATIAPAQSAAVYFQEGETALEKGHYDEALAAWGKVRDSYYSPELNILAELKIAETYYRAERYIEASTAYEDFLKQHPGHGRTEEALYWLGKSYYQQILSPDRDQTATRSTLVTFETLIKRYPQSVHRQEAQELVANCRDRLADHELYVGSFYLRTGHAEAAVGRLAGLLQDYPKYNRRDETLFQLGEAYRQAGAKEKAVATFRTLTETFPHSEYAGKARKCSAN